MDSGQVLLSHKCDAFVKCLYLMAVSGLPISRLIKGRSGTVGCMCLTRYVEVVGSSLIPLVSLSKKLYPYCLVLVGSRSGFEHDFIIKLK